MFVNYVNSQLIQLYEPLLRAIRESEFIVSSPNKCTQTHYYYELSNFLIMKQISYNSVPSKVSQ